MGHAPFVLVGGPNPPFYTSMRLYPSPRPSGGDPPKISTPPTRFELRSEPYKIPTIFLEYLDQSKTLAGRVGDDGNKKAPAPVRGPGHVRVQLDLAVEVQAQGDNPHFTGSVHGDVALGAGDQLGLAALAGAEVLGQVYGDGQGGAFDSDVDVLHGGSSL